MELTPEDNLVLIGMPWSGKSTLGVLLAKALARPFTDTDLLIQQHAGKRLQAIIDGEGVEALRALEERILLGLDRKGHVIATGGSVVYSGVAMRHLKAQGRCVYLQLPLDALEARATNLDLRGLVRAPGQTLADLFAQRTPLYERYADMTFSCAGKSHDEVLWEIVREIGIGDGQ